MLMRIFDTSDYDRSLRRRRLLGFGLLAAVVWWWYPLRKAVVERNVATLKRKRERIG